MGSIYFADLSKVAANAEAQKRNAFEMDRTRRADAAEARDQETGTHFGAAIQGDKDAQARVMSNPKFALPLAQFLERADTNQRAKVKEAIELTGRTAAGILALPEDQQPAAYEAAHRTLTQQGYKIDLPPRWSPALKGQLQSYAVQVPEYLKMLDGQPQPMGGAPGMPASVAGGGGADRSANAISGIESGGRYDAVGPAANEKGQRAYGKYQIMDFNVGPWTREVLGKPMTPQEFLANPQAQDAVFKSKFGQYTQKYGSPEAASRAWFAGEGGMNNPNAKDVLGTSVQGYGQKFAQAYGEGASGAPPGMAVGDTQPRADASGTPLPPQAASPEVFELNSWLRKSMPGARPMGVKGKPVYDSQGKLMVQQPDGSVGFVDVPKPQQPPSGFQPNPAGGLQPIPGGPADPARERAAKVPSGYRIAADGQSYEPVPGGPVDPNAKGPSPKEVADLRKARVEAQTIVGALEDFRKEFTAADFGTRAKSVAGATTGLNTSYNAAALLAKGEELFNLGVLNGPDLDIIRRTLPDPSTFRGASASPAAMNSAVDKVIGILQSRLSAKEAQLGLSPSSGQPAAAAPPAAAPAPQSTPNASPIAEGATATNPQTGERVIFSGGQWRPTR